MDFIRNSKKWILSLMSAVLVFTFASSSLAATNSEKMLDSVECPSCHETVKAQGSQEDKDKAFDIVKSKFKGLTVDPNTLFVTVLDDDTNKVALVQYSSEGNTYQHYVNLNAEDVFITYKGEVNVDKETGDVKYKMFADGILMANITVQSDGKLINNENGKVIDPNEFENKTSPTTETITKAYNDSTAKVSTMAVKADSKLSKCKDLVGDIVTNGGLASCGLTCGVLFGVVGAAVCIGLCAFIESQYGKASANEICTQFFG